MYSFSWHQPFRWLVAMISQRLLDGKEMSYRRVQTIAGKGDAAGRFKQSLRGIAVDTIDNVYLVGDSSLKVFSSEGKLLRHWPTARQGFSVAVDLNDDVYVGEPGQVEIFSPKGVLKQTWHNVEKLGLVTAIGMSGQHVVLADAKARRIRKFNRSGKFLADIGNDKRGRGFHVPNGHLDFVLGTDAVLHVTHSGRHRVERYTLEGKRLGHFGRFTGQDPVGFTGCCNPTNLSLLPNGEVVVTVKARPAVKRYDAAGKLVSMFGEKDFDPACKNMDLAVDSKGRVYVIDTVSLCVYVYADADVPVSSQPTEAEGRSRTGVMSPAMSPATSPSSKAVKP